jgi:Holliday junction resolvase RusA-like endonuclease
MSSLRFTIPGEPRGRGRKRIATRGRGGVPLPFAKVYPMKEDVQYENLIRVLALEARPQDWKPIEGPVSLTVSVWASMRGQPRKRLPRPAAWKVTKPDADSIAALVMDSLEGIAYPHDAQVAELVVRKHTAAQGVAAFVAVEVQEAPPCPMTS